MLWLRLATGASPTCILKAVCYLDRGGEFITCTHTHPGAEHPSLPWETEGPSLDSTAKSQHEITLPLQEIS